MPVLRCIGLGLLVGAFLPVVGGAQGRDTIPARRDTTHRPAPGPARPDSLPRDTVASDTGKAPAAIIRRDTLKAPLAEAEAPPMADVGDGFRWDRAALFATGAITLQDLLDRVPGITGFRTDWIATPQTAAYLGNVARVRVFYDGVELDEPDPRNASILDLSQVQIWSLEEVRLERGADELRIYLRSWRVDRTTPSTRTDILTGDQQTNVYRGFFGRRYSHGEAIQTGAQQYSTSPTRRGATSDQLGLLGRLGWARGRWSVDAFLLRTNRHRGVAVSEISPDSIPTLASSRSDAYLRGAFGDPDRGLWAQGIASALGYTLTGNGSSSAGAGAFQIPGTQANTSDTSLVRSQYVLAGGFTRWGVRLSATERIRRWNTPPTAITNVLPLRARWQPHHLATPSVRAGFESRFFGLSVFSEGRGLDSTSRTEGLGYLAPFSFVRFGGAVSRVHEYRAGATFAGSGLPTRVDGTTSTNARVDGRLRLAGLWLGGGLMRRDAVRLPAPQVYDSTFVRSHEGPATGTFAIVQGTIYRALKADAFAVRWSDSTGFYRPRYQTRTELYIATNLLNRFPSGNFGLLLSGVHEYRSSTRFPTADTVATVLGSRVLTVRLEIRILSAVAFAQFRNAQGDPYGLIPNFLMPRQNTFYGVRWEFWN